MNDEQKALVERWQEACWKVAERPYYNDGSLSPDVAEESALQLLGVARQLAGRACEACRGAGKHWYSSTATWRGGMGGASMSYDVCDKCWGTGRNDVSGPDLRKYERAIADAKLENARDYIAYKLGVKTTMLDTSRFLPYVAEKLRDLRPPKGTSGVDAIYFRSMCAGLYRMLDGIVELEKKETP